MMQIIPRAKSTAIKAILQILPEPHYVAVSIFGLKRKPAKIQGIELNDLSVSSSTRLKHPSKAEILRLINRSKEISSLERKASIKVTGNYNTAFISTEYSKLKKNSDWKKAEKMRKPNIQFKEAYFLLDDKNARATLTEYGIDIHLPMHLKGEFLRKFLRLPKLEDLQVKITIL